MQDNKDMSVDDILSSIKKYISIENESVNESRVEENVISINSAEVRDNSSKGFVKLKPLKEIYEIGNEEEPAGPVNIEMPKFFKKAAKNIDIKDGQNISNDIEKNVNKPVAENVPVNESVNNSRAILNDFKENITTLMKNATDVKANQIIQNSFDTFIYNMITTSVKEWLDENLESIVEKFVEQEIKKITESIVV